MDTSGANIVYKKTETRSVVGACFNAVLEENHFWLPFATERPKETNAAMSLLNTDCYALTLARQEGL